MTFEIPDTPYLVAGGVGGPLVYFTVTPARNALTLGATNRGASVLYLYRQAFSQGFLRGWAGGIYPSMAACPSFLCLGPAYHAIKPSVGVPGAVFLSSCLESLFLFGAETKNAQIAKNEAAPGTIKRVVSPFKPFGPGIAIHIGRNTLATAGLRILCNPCTLAIEALSGKKNSVTQVSGDFVGNVIAACLTAPIHQLYGFVVTTPELSELGLTEKRTRCMQFLKDQYLVNGRLSATVPRDLFMRSAYVATLYTMYVSLERALINNWPKSD